MAAFSAKLLAAVAVAALVTSCAAAPVPQRSALAADATEIVVVAPHPDDETLIAGGVIAAARARGAHVAVIVVTNGDFTCERDGHVRQGETVAAVARLGVPEEDVHFLGYPDGWLIDLGEDPLPPLDRRSTDGTCAKAGGTYAERGAAHRDEHTARTGAPAVYVARSLEDDLAALLARLRPRDLYVTHPLDRHPDHAATYAYVRRALHRVAGAPPRIHAALVHVGPCWPNGRGMTEPCPVITDHDFASPIPPLPDPYAAYVPTERITVADPARKLAAIAEYHSQLGDDPDHDWLTSFARADEPFWLESNVRGPTARVALSPASLSADVAPYRIELAPPADAVSVFRGDRLVRKWMLPLSRRDSAHTFDVTITARPERHVAAIEVARDGALLGVAIDPGEP